MEGCEGLRQIVLADPSAPEARILQRHVLLKTSNLEIARDGHKWRQDLRNLQFAFQMASKSAGAVETPSLQIGPLVQMSASMFF
jgi:hypothetical protein